MGDLMVELRFRELLDAYGQYLAIAYIGITMLAIIVANVWRRTGVR